MTAEGTLILDDFDTYAAAGGRNIAHDRTFAVTVKDGTLDVAFTGVVDVAVVSAVQVVWAGELRLPGRRATPQEDDRQYHHLPSTHTMP